SSRRVPAGPYCSAAIPKPTAAASSQDVMARKLLGGDLARLRLLHGGEAPLAVGLERGLVDGQERLPASRFERRPRIVLDAIDEHLEMQMRRGRQSRHADVRNRFSLVDSRADVDAGGEPEQVAISGHVSVAVSQVQHVAVAMFLSSKNHDGVTY